MGIAILVPVSLLAYLLLSGARSLRAPAKLASGRISKESRRSTLRYAPQLNCMPAAIS